mmetsp:Transcript_3765/g.5742  ORF Transcript_3765/g.5742 Transcript_3765/m.5742 type:complete len:131 (+) Transcript_3765:52-444(+)
MCENAAPGSCFVGSFLLGGTFGVAFGFVGDMIHTRVGLPIGVSFGASLGTLAAAFPDGPHCYIVLYVLGSALAGSFLTYHNISELPIVALVSSACVNLALLCTGALHRRKDYHDDNSQMPFLLKQDERRV